MKGCWIFDGSAPINSGAYTRWWNRQIKFLETLPPSELTNPKNCSRFLRQWYFEASKIFIPLGRKNISIKYLFKKRALFIISKNLIYFETTKDFYLREIGFSGSKSIATIMKAGINYMYGNRNNECYKQFEVFKKKLVL